MKETFVLVTDLDGCIVNPDGVCLRRSNSPFKATPPDLCGLSKHWIMNSRPPGALPHGLLFISVLLNSAASFEKIHRFRSVLIFSY